MSEQGAGKNTGAGYKRKDIKEKDEKAYEILEFPTKKVILTNQDKKKREWCRGVRSVSTAKDLGDQFIIILICTSHKRGNSIFENKNMPDASEIVFSH